MISKKLFKETTGITAKYIVPKASGKNMIFNQTDDLHKEEEINIYELAFLVRDYLLDEYGFVLTMEGTASEIIEQGSSCENFLKIEKATK